MDPITTAPLCRLGPATSPGVRDYLNAIGWACVGPRKRNRDIFDQITGEEGMSVRIRVSMRPHADPFQDSSTGYISCRFLNPNESFARQFGDKGGLYLCDGTVLIEDGFIVLRIDKVIKIMSTSLRLIFLQRTITAYNWSLLPLANKLAHLARTLTP